MTLDSGLDFSTVPAACLDECHAISRQLGRDSLLHGTSSRLQVSQLSDPGFRRGAVYDSLHDQPFRMANSPRTDLRGLFQLSSRESRANRFLDTGQKSGCGRAEQGGQRGDYQRRENCSCEGA